IAPAMDWEPPTGILQPYLFPTAISTIPMAEVVQLDNGCMPWAAIPAHRALPFSVLNERASQLAGCNAPNPNEANCSGFLGKRNGPIVSRARLSQCSTTGWISFL